MTDEPIDDAAEPQQLSFPTMTPEQAREGQVRAQAIRFTSLKCAAINLSELSPRLQENLPSLIKKGLFMLRTMDDELPNIVVNTGFIEPIGQVYPDDHELFARFEQAGFSYVFVSADFFGDEHLL